MPTGNGQPRTYDLTLPADYTVGNTLNLKQLTRQLNNDPALAANQVDYMQRKADLLNIFFTNALTGAEETAADAVVLAHDGKVSGKNFRFGEANAVQSTTQQSWQDAFSITAQPVQEGTYIITWQCEVRIVPTGPLNSRAALRVQVDGNNKGLGSWEHDDWTTISGWDRSRFEEGEEPVINIQYRRDPDVGGNDTIEIRRIRLGIELKED